MADEGRKDKEGRSSTDSVLSDPFWIGYEDKETRIQILAADLDLDPISDKLNKGHLHMDLRKFLKLNKLYICVFVFVSVSVPQKSPIFYMLLEKSIVS